MQQGRPRGEAVPDLGVPVERAELPPSTLRAACDSPSPGTLLGGNCRVIGALGEGAMGSVLLAHDEVLGRDVAVKLVHPSLRTTPESCEMFLREARTMARIRHENVAAVHSMGLWNDSPYLVMEYVPGGGLDRWLALHPIPTLQEALGILRQVCQGVHAIHQAGSAHRDIKPGNILIAPPFRMVLVDFGVAVSASPVGSWRDRPLCCGTPDYMAPEQIVGSPLTNPVRSDVYSLGVLAFLLLTGTLPFGTGTAPQVLTRHLTRPAPAPSSVRAGLPAAFDEPVCAALQKDPALRPDSPEAFFRSLQRASEPGSKTQQLRVVIADREPVFRALAGVTVRERIPGARVETFDDGLGTLEAMDRETTHLAILGSRLRGMSAVELVAAVRGGASPSPPRFIVVSETDSPADAKLLSDLGVESLLSKPVGRKQLTRSVVSVLGLEPPLAARELAAAPQKRSA